MSNAIICKRTGQGVAMKLDGGVCMCPSVDQCALISEEPTKVWPFERRYWFMLPLELRQRWWRETDYSTKIPSNDLMIAVVKALSEKSDGIVIARS